MLGFLGEWRTLPFKLASNLELDRMQFYSPRLGLKAPSPSKGEVLGLVKLATGKGACSHGSF